MSNEVTVLIVDDEEDILESIEDILDRLEGLGLVEEHYV